MEMQPKNRTVRPDGEAIKRLRLEKGWRVEDLATKAICSVKTVENIERGANVYVFTLAKIAKALGVEFMTLVQGGKPPPEPPKPESCVQVKVEVSIPFDQFDESEQLDGLITVLKGLLSGGGNIRVVGVAPGSTIITLEMTVRDMLALHSAYDEGKLAEILCIGFTPILHPELIPPGVKTFDPEQADKSKESTRPDIEPDPPKSEKHKPKTEP